MQELFKIGGSVFAEKPHKDIYNFVGNFIMVIFFARCNFKGTFDFHYPCRRLVMVKP